MYLLLEHTTTQATAASVSPLEETLIDLLDLSLQAEQARRRFPGPGFRGIHLCLGQLVEQYRDWREEVVARLGTIGASSNGRIAALAAARPLELLPAGKLEDRDVIRFFDDRIAFLVGRVRAGLDTLGDRDQVSRDLLAGIAGWLEMQGVFLRAHLSPLRAPDATPNRPHQSRACAFRGDAVTLRPQ